MSEQADCLQYIIGLSQTNCECFDDGKPIDYSRSDSGIWLDQVEGLELNMADAIKNCEQGSLWEIMQRAKNNAIKAFKADVLAGLLTKYKHRRQPFSGVIGSASSKNTLSLSTNFAGERIYSNNTIGGVMNIKRIGVFMDGDYSFDIEIRSEIDEDPIYIIPVISQANKLTWNDVDVELSMNLETDDNPNYYITYQVNGMKPKDTTNGCGCSQSVYHYYWNLQRPLFKSFEKARWSEFIMITGVTGNDISERENWTTSHYNNGLFLDVNFDCKVGDLICSEDFDFVNNGIALSMAYAIRFRAAFILIDTLLASSNINRYTMMNRERLMEKKNTYNKEYFDRIEWIVNEINYKANDCLVCNDFEDLVKIGIMA